MSTITELTSSEETYFISNALKVEDGNRIFYESSEIVLSFKASTTASLKNALLNQYNLVLISNEGFYSRYRSNDALSDAAGIYETGLVHFSHPNFMLQANLNSDPPIIPNDPYFNKQYYLHNTGQIINDNDSGFTNADMDVAEAWNITKGDSNLIIAVIDDGFDSTHPDLPSNRYLRLNGANVAAVQLNDSNNFNNISGFGRHGSNCVGIIGAEHDNGIGISGIAPGSKIMPVRFSQGQSYLYSSHFAGVYDFANVNGAKVISGSFSIIPPDSLTSLPLPVVDSAINAAIDNDIVICMASGNTRNLDPISPAYNPEDSLVLYPANHINDDLICVGASDKKNRIAQYSPYSRHIDVVAPSSSSINGSDNQSISYGHLDVWAFGGNIYNSGNGLLNDTTPDFGPDSNRFTGRFGGTSAATPMVAGIAGLVRSVNPCLSNRQVKKVLLQTADKIGNYNYNWNSTMPGHSKEAGYGKVNAYKAVRAAEVMNSSSLDLFIKDVPEDFGYEPDTVAKYLYISEDIWIRNNPDGFAKQWHETPFYAPNTPVYVYVRVTNKSCVDALAGDSLELYWSKAATALSWPNHWNGSINTPVLMGDEIGTMSLDTVLAGTEKILQFSWQPPDPNNYNGVVPEFWHFCLLARIVSPTDTMTFAEDSILWSNVKYNNNIAWKNISIVRKNPLTGSFDPEIGLGAVVAIGSELEEESNNQIRFSTDNESNGTNIIEDAEIRIKLDSTALAIWQSGGQESQGLEYLGDGIFLIDGENPSLDNLTFAANQRATIHVGFNMLTEEVSDKIVYHFYVEQYANDDFVGGEQYLIHRDERNLFQADAGPDATVDAGQQIRLQAYLIGEAATYNWYDQGGNIFFSGTDTTFVPSQDEEYTLEVIAHDDGYKDYDTKLVTIRDYFISSIYPNPVNSPNSLTVEYEASTANSAYLVITNITTSTTSTYVLNLTQTNIQISTASFINGTYLVSLYCNGVLWDSENLIIN